LGIVDNLKRPVDLSGFILYFNDNIDNVTLHVSSLMVSSNNAFNGFTDCI